MGKIKETKEGWNMDIFDFMTMLGGLSLFLFGMSLMGSALERRAGSRLRSLLDQMTGKPLVGFLTGLGVTAIIQSSSATTVMVVGFVNSGLMTLRQAINVIMGANVGTTVTAWLLSLGGIESSSVWLRLLKPSSFTPVLALIGIVFYMFCKDAKKKDTGTILLGFATLMFGMETMSGAVSGLSQVPAFTNLFLAFRNPILGVLVGAVLTGIIQSSSASVGILQALSATGAVSYAAAIPIIMGQNIGTTVTAMLSSVGTNKNARRVHLLFNVIGVAVLLSVFCIVRAVLAPALLDESATRAGIAVAHSVFNLLCTAMLLPAGDLLEKLAIRRESVKTLQTVEAWERAKLQHYVDTLPCRIYLLSEDPDGLRGVSPAKMARARQGRYGVIKPYRDQMEGRYQWCIAAVPGVAWAKKVFPNETKARAVEKLWEAILHTCRVDDDPIAAWNAHNADLQARCDHLNSLGIASLEYHASNGTNLTVGMIPEAQFCGGGEYTIGGSYFNPNLPTEECFISPKRGEAEGIVYSSKPLSYQGQLIEDFSIRFEHGRAVEAHARTNEALLQKLIAMDEGSAYLGECALVPYDSPINQTGILFYNTLFDENACCHLALGMGFIDTIRDYPNRTLEEMRALGVNDSMIHEDFMIGTPDLAITAHCRDGRTVPVFRDGTWAF